MDPTQIRFKAGEPHLFITTRPFALGNTQVTVAKGTEILFDGTKAEVDGTEYALPQLRGAIKAGWLVLAEDYDEEAIVARPSANISVRHPTQGGNPMHPKQSMATSVSEEERVAGNAQQFAHNTRTANTGFVRGQTKVNVGGIQGQQTVMTQRGMMVIESQEGHVVPRAPLKTAAGEKAKSQRTSADMASQVEQQLSKVSITPVQGVSRDELMESMSEEERAEYMANIESRKAAYVNEPPVIKAGDGRKVVGGAKKTGTSTREGITVKTSTGRGIETVDLSGASKPAEVSQTESEGIKFTTTNGPKRDQAPSAHPRQAAAAPAAKPKVNVDIRRKMAKTACPHFPDNYVFDAPAKKKIARLRADYEDQEDILQAVFLAEDDEMKALLVEEFPETFAG